MTVKVLFRYSKKTGKIDRTLTAINLPLLKLYAMENTTKTKNSIVIERDTGKVLFVVEGTQEWPVIVKGDLGNCAEYGIPLEAVQSIKDERFDREENHV